MTQKLYANPLLDEQNEYAFTAAEQKNGTLHVTYYNKEDTAIIREVIDPSEKIVLEGYELNAAGKPAGRYQSFHANGLLHISGTRQENGVFCGEYLEAYDNTNIKMVGVRTPRGIFIGTCTTFYQNGNPDEVTTLNMVGDMVGGYKKYTEDGKLLRHNFRDPLGNVIENYPVDDEYYKAPQAPSSDILNELHATCIDILKTKPQAHVEKLLNKINSQTPEAPNAANRLTP